MYEPIAIVGMGCRFPGNTNSPKDFWELLLKGADAIEDIPADRWNHKEYYTKNRNQPGGIISRQGGFIQNVKEFDHEFFGISEKEAKYIDPQQRIALQVTWEAFEQGGLLPDDWKNQQTGVFMGCFTSDYHSMQFLSQREYNIYSSTGMMNTMLSNRISHAFGFLGPSMSIDTACSASMTSLHQACRSIQNGECSSAVAGGSLLMLLPDLQIAETQTGFLSKDSRCKSFGKNANGYVRSEGVGIILLKSLNKAIQDQDNIQAVIKGSALNQDGSTASITLPSKKSQIHVMKQACRMARISGDSINFIEAHGTGTSAGDPIEAQSISEAYKNSKSIPIGSCKSNIGHLESAAGIAGIIKSVLCLQNKIFPKSLHSLEPNPNIDFKALNLFPAQTNIPLSPNEDNSYFAGVNSFGFGGSNAHVILQDSKSATNQLIVTPNKKLLPFSSSPNKSESKPFLEIGIDSEFVLPVSAKNVDSLKALIKIFIFEIKKLPTDQLKNFCYSAARHRTHHLYRKLFVGKNKEELIQKLKSFIEKKNQSSPPKSNPNLLWVFPGLGSLTYGESKKMIQKNRSFRNHFLHCSKLYQSISGISLIDILNSNLNHTPVLDHYHSHALCFINQVCLGELLKDIGIHPQVSLGHSGGEITAFYFSNIYSLKDCLSIIHYRATILDTMNISGSMVSARISFEKANSILTKLNSSAVISSHLSQNDITFSGDDQSIKILMDYLKHQSIAHIKLNSATPYHHKTLLKKYLDHWNKFTIPQVSPNKTRLWSSITGKQITSNEIDRNYFADNVLNPVQFISAFNSILKQSKCHILEISIQARLLTKEHNSDNCNVLNLQNPFNLKQVLIDSYEHGISINWNQLYPSGKFISLPTYPWIKNIHWHEPKYSETRRLKKHNGTFLGYQNKEHEWVSLISREKHAFLSDHIICGEVILPGALYLEIAFEALAVQYPQFHFKLSNIQFLHAQQLEVDESIFLRTQIIPDQNKITFKIKKNQSDASFIKTAILDFFPISNARLGITENIDSFPSNTTSRYQYLDGSTFYKDIKSINFEYKNQFCGIQKIYSSEYETWCKISINQQILDTSSIFHPIAIDIAFQCTLAHKMGQKPNTTDLELPSNIENVQIFQKIPKTIWCKVKVVEITDRYTKSELHLFNENCENIAVINGFTTKKIKSLSKNSNSSISKITWDSYPINDSTQPQINTPFRKTIIIADHSGFASDFVQFLVSKNCEYEYIILEPKQPKENNNIDHLSEQLSHTLSNEDESCQILFCTSIDIQNEKDILPFGCLPIISIAKAIRSSNFQGRCWFLTKNAYSNQTAINPYQGPILGLARTFLSREFSQNAGGIIDIQDHSSLQTIWNILSNHDLPSIEFQINQLEIFIPSLSPYYPIKTQPNLAFDSNAAYLVSGAFGSIGKNLCHWLTKKGAKNLILLSSRKAPTLNQIKNKSELKWLDEIISSGVQCQIIRVNLQDPTKINSLKHQIDLSKVKGVFYCAGKTNDEFIENISNINLQETLGVKLTGAWGIHKLFQNHILDHFVLFSSLTSHLPTHGSASYSAANCSLNSLATFRKKNNLPALSISWGAWGEGMVQNLGLNNSFQRQGIECIKTEEGFKLLNDCILSDEDNLLIYSINWEVFLKNKNKQKHFFKNYIQRVSTNPINILSNPEKNLKSQLINEICESLQVSENEIELDKSLIDQGLDSLSSMVMIDIIQQETKINFSLSQVQNGISLNEILRKIELLSATKETA